MPLTMMRRSRRTVGPPAYFELSPFPVHPQRVLSSVWARIPTVASGLQQG